MPKPTTQESLLHEKIGEMRQEFEIRMLNVVVQMRAICLAAGISPLKFLENFHDDKAQNAFFQELNEIEKKLVDQKKKEMEEKQAQMGGQSAPAPTEEEMRDVIEGEGDKII